MGFCFSAPRNPILNPIMARGLGNIRLMGTLTHLSDMGASAGRIPLPRMVDVSTKATTRRSATAEGCVYLPSRVLAHLVGAEGIPKKSAM